MLVVDTETRGWDNMSKTLVRIYEENDGFMGCEVMTSHLKARENYQVIGMLELAKKALVDEIETENMTDEEVKASRRLLD